MTNGLFIILLIISDYPIAEIGNTVLVFLSHECSTGCCEINVIEIFVEDVEAPVFDPAVSDAVVSCPSAIPPVEALTWTDNCAGTGVEMPVEEFVGDNCLYNIIRTWSYEDQCGNIGTFVQTIYVQPIPPLLFAPADITYECLADLPPLGNIDSEDQCDGTITVVPGIEIDEGGSCPKTLGRYWEVVDACGNLTIASQMITITNSTIPTLSNPPADATVSCISDAPAVQIEWSDECQTGLVDPIQSWDVSTCPAILTRLWTYQDPCGNIEETIQTVTIDPVAPVVTDIVVDACSLDSQAELDSLFAAQQNDLINTLFECYDVIDIIAGPVPQFDVGGSSFFEFGVIDVCGSFYDLSVAFNVVPCVCSSAYNYSVDPICSGEAPNFIMDPNCTEGSLTTSCLDLYIYAPDGIPAKAPDGFDPLASLNGIGTFPLSNDGLVFVNFAGNLAGGSICADLPAGVLTNLGNQPEEVTYFILPWVNYIDGNNDNTNEYNNIHPGACPILQYDVIVSPDTSCIACHKPIENEILDNATLTTEQIVINETGTINDLNLHLDLDHTWIGDLVITLEHNGTTVTLLDNGCINDHVMATFDDQALVASDTLCQDSIALTGFVIPNESLSAFNGVDPNGLWILSITDNFTLDQGELNYWCIEVNSAECVDILDLAGSSGSSIHVAGLEIHSDQIITPPNEVEYSAGEFIELTNNFEVELGADFEAYIEGCDIISMPRPTNKTKFTRIEPFTGNQRPKR